MFSLVAIGAILNRFRGGGIIPDKGPRFLRALRKPLSVIAFGSMAAWLAHSHLLGNLYVIIIGCSTAGCFIVPNLVTPRPGFTAFNGIYPGDAERQYSFMNRWIYNLADRAGYPVGMKGVMIGPSVIAHNRRWGLWFMSLRGLYITLITSVVASVTLKPIIALVGSLGVFQGLCYWLVGFLPRSRFDNTIAELLSGMLVGIISYLMVLVV